MNKIEIIRYSESFKLQIVKEYEKSHLTIKELSLKYGIRGGSTVGSWIKKYGSASLQNKMIRVESLKEKDQLKSLQAENQRLKEALAHQTVVSITHESMLEVLAKRQGLSLDELKKKLGKKL